MSQGYYLHPAIYGGTIAFVSEGSLWIADKQGGAARRLTEGYSEVLTPAFSPDGQSIAFSSVTDGCRELYTVSTNTCELKRLTFLGSTVTVVGWIDEGILFSCSCYRPFNEWNEIWIYPQQGGLPRRIPVGLASFISFQDGISSPSVIQRHGYREYSSWKRYRGGTAGEVWIDGGGSKSYRKLVDLSGYVERPLFIKDRIYFLSDHEGVGNIYSVSKEGSDIKRHTHHVDYYVRNIYTDRTSIVYHAGGDLYVLDLASKACSLFKVNYQSSKPRRSRVFFDSSKYLDSFTAHPHGLCIGLITRGIPFLLKGTQGPALRIGKEQASRYRLLNWLYNMEDVLLVHDEDDEDRLEIWNENNPSSKSPRLGIGRIVDVRPSPRKMEACVVNHRNEIIHVDLQKWEVTIVDRSKFSTVHGIDWSPCGNWIAYSVSVTHRTSAIKIWDSKRGIITQVTQPILQDIEPSFDQNGKFLYFLSYREFRPKREQDFNLHLDLDHYLYGMRPYLVTLQKEVQTPFDLDLSEQKGKWEEASLSKTQNRDVLKDIVIDLEGIEHRIVPFPVSCGTYSSIDGLNEKVIYLSFKDVEEDSGELMLYDLRTKVEEKVADEVSSVSISHNKEWICYRTESMLNLIDSGWSSTSKANPDSQERKQTKRIFNLSCVVSSVEARLEWEQIYKEAWRLQRDHFWVEDMSKVDWNLVYKRYYKLLDRISTREELTDLLWEMQGELGTSHAYAISRKETSQDHHALGSLGAEFSWSDKDQAYTILNLVRGDCWSLDETQPLFKPGLNICDGDLLHQVNGVPVCSDIPPEALLIRQEGKNVELTLSHKGSENRRKVTVKTTGYRSYGRYRDWVEKNRSLVHRKTNGRSGYIHIPDMGTRGLSEFFRAYLREFEADGLIIDVRFNSGGNISSILLEKLANKRIGYDWTRWFGVVPYPIDSPVGPMVALINEYTGSDGDIFSHAFKILKLGPLIGKRTWGGVIGILPRYSLVDGYITTQPEFSFWSKEAGWSIENNGVSPDFDVEVTPRDYMEEHDPQLETSISILSSLIKERQPVFPSLESKKNLKVPRKLSSYSEDY